MSKSFEKIDKPEGLPSETEYEPLSLETVERLEQAESEAEIKEILPHFFSFLELEVGAKIETDINIIYEEIERQHELVRLENMRKVVEALSSRHPMKIGDGEDHYANAVIPENEGIRIALAEGEAPGPVKLLIGFDVKTAIGFNPEGLRVHDIDQGEFDLRDTSLRAALCRHVEGELPPEQIHHIVTRVPRGLMPVELMTDGEKKTDSLYVFRGAKILPERLPLSFREALSVQHDLIERSGIGVEWVEKYAKPFRKEVTRDPQLREFIRMSREEALVEIERRLEPFTSKAVA